MVKYFLIAVFCFISLSAAAQHCDLVIGRWADKALQVQISIYKKGSKYSGKVVWLKTPNGRDGHPLTDMNNIRPEERKRPIMNLEVLKNFTCNGGKLIGGIIYDPRRGKNFKGEIMLAGNKLKVIAKMGMFEAGNEIWTKVEN